MSNAIKLGMTVKLKSGGPLMTVIEAKDGSDVWVCRWFDNKQQLQTASFNGHELKEVDDSAHFGIL